MAVVMAVKVNGTLKGRLAELMAIVPVYCSSGRFAAGLSQNHVGAGSGGQGRDIGGRPKRKPGDGGEGDLQRFAGGPADVGYLKRQQGFAPTTMPWSR